ncbi:MAG: zinc ribbon domain-containing protein [Prevotellaceae bacterium]|nr:zinc ribbon domain-containing protein [Prevotellaceae bacterium]
MEQQQSLSKRQIKRQQSTITPSEAPATRRVCTNCGTPFHDGDKFCEECGMPLSAASCPHCGVAVQPQWEICPSCGHSLQPDQCSFCGAPLDHDDTFCPECGNPRAGIACPGCGTLNFRSFCRKCNRPLNEAADREMQRAQKDPVFQQMVALAGELADLEAQLTGQGDNSEGDNQSGVAQDEPAVALNQADQALLERYQALFDGRKVEASTASPPKPTAPSVAPQPVQRESKIKLTIAKPELNGTAEAYKEKVEEMQRLMQKLRPEGDMTPQMQRNYYSARKLPVLKKTVTKVPAYWICNLCHARHLQPSECAQPQLGGEWVYDDIITAKRVFEYED